MVCSICRSANQEGMAAGPTARKRRKADDANWRIRAILPDAFTEEVPLQWVYVATLRSKQHISPIMQELSKLLPLPATLQHLKRVRQLEVILGRPADMGVETSVSEFLAQAQLSAQTIDWLSESVRELEVPGAPIKLRWQYEATKHRWPCKFHPDRYMESLYSGTNFTEAECRFHSRMGALLLKLSQTGAARRPFCVCVDPRSRSIVAMAASKTAINPVMHAPMVLIDYVARTQNAGAWNGIFENVVFLEDACSDEEPRDTTLAGIEQCHYDLVQSDVEFEDLRFGAEKFRGSSVKLADSCLLEGSDNLAKFGPYLCTGYDVYLSEEPCLMCAMALVHSRVRRIFFVRSARDGALHSSFKLHAVKELNHHYEVFHCTPPMSESDDPAS